MNTLGLFRLNDITTEKLVFKNIDEREFVKRLSFITDSSTNTGFLTGKKKFHGLINENNFRLKKIRTGGGEEFIIKGKLIKRGKDLVVEIEIKRGLLPTLLPTFVFVVATIIITSQLINGKMDYRYIPFLLAGIGIGIWLLSLLRTRELDKVKNHFYGLYKPDE